MNMGMAMPSWYDIKGLDMKSNEQCDGIEESRQRLETILQTEHSHGEMSQVVTIMSPVANRTLSSRLADSNYITPRTQDIFET